MMLKSKSLIELKVSGAFMAIGHDPATELFVESIKNG